jgi:uncharacterized membrane protein YdjX (TVP38/TMEM64 family)
VDDEPKEIEAAPARRVERLRRAALIALALGAAVALYLGGAFDDPERTVLVIRRAGAWGALAYLAAFSLIQPLGVSGHVFTLAAAVVWGGWIGFGLALAGAVASACVSFGYARYVAFEWVQARIPERVREYEKWLVARGLYGVVVYRLLTFTMPPAQLLIGTLRVPFRTMLAGTAIGFVPAVGVDIFLGGELWAWLVS